MWKIFFISDVKYTGLEIIVKVFVEGVVSLFFRKERVRKVIGGFG